MGKKLIIIISRVYWFLKGISWRLSDIRYHFVAVYANRKFKVMLLKHEEYIEITETTLARMFKSLPREEFIKQALDKTEDCKFIIFFCTNDKMVHVWRGSGKILFEFPVIKTKKMQNFKFRILGQLAEEGFAKNTGVFTFPEKTFRINAETGGEVIQANFGKNSETASKFCIDVLTQVFHHNLQDLQYQIG